MEDQDYKRYTDQCLACKCPRHCMHSCQECETCPDCECELCQQGKEFN